MAKEQVEQLSSLQRRLYLMWQKLNAKTLWCMEKDDAMQAAFDAGWSECYESIEEHRVTHVKDRV